eukprot:464046_1
MSRFTPLSPHEALEWVNHKSSKNIFFKELIHGYPLPESWDNPEFVQKWNNMQNQYRELMNNYYEAMCLDESHTTKHLAWCCCHQTYGRSPNQFVEERLKILQHHSFSTSFYDRELGGSCIIGCFECAIQMLLQTRLFSTIYHPFDINKRANVKNAWVSMEYVITRSKTCT